MAITDFGLAVQLMAGPGHSQAASTSPSQLSNLYSTLWTSPTLALSVFISPPEVREAMLCVLCVLRRRLSLGPRAA